MAATADADDQRIIAHLAAIVESSDDAIISKTLEGVIRSWNSGAQRMFGYSAQEAIGQSITLIIPPERLAEEHFILDTLKRGERIDHFETTRKAKDGSLVEVSLTVSPMCDAAGIVIGASKIARDISARKHNEQMLCEANAALQSHAQALLEADRQKDEFIALLGHELRNPIAPICNASEFLSRTLSQDQRAQIAVDTIKRQAAQLTRLVDDLLDVGRITQGRVELQRRPVELTAVISQAMEMIEPQLREKQHNISIARSGLMPVYVDGDLARLVQCVGNLLTNAVKYTAARGEISVRTHGEDCSAVIEIADTGAGISAQLLPRVFDLFIQDVRTLDRAQGGLGIGLSVVKRLVKMHGGEVTAHSEGVGCGSTFRIRLPRIEPPQAPASAAAPLKAAARRVLIVDDNADAANSLAMILALGGHETRVALRGDAALELIASFKPEVALLDLGLPEMTGYDLAQHLRTIPDLNGIRLVALTGYGQAEDYRRSRAAGFDDHLVKPVDFRALERTLAGIAGGWGRVEGRIS